MFDKLRTMHTGNCVEEKKQLNALVRDLKSELDEVKHDNKKLAEQVIIYLREIEEGKAIFDSTMFKLEEEKKVLEGKFKAIEKESHGGSVAGTTR